MKLFNTINMHFFNGFCFLLVITQLCWSQEISNRVYFSVPEGEPPNTFVGQIPTETGYSYRFLEDTEYFILDSIAGAIRTAQELDRESLHDDTIDLVVLGTSLSSSTSVLEITVTVEDINDNSPEFPQSMAEIYFLESANIGSSVILDTASDEDIGVNDVTIDYSIVGGEEELFELVVTTNPSGDTFLHIQTTGNLDRETKNLYQLNISARDGGSPSKLGYMLLDIIVRDTNDNAPIFNETNYQLSVKEGVIVGTHIVRVFAHDEDEGVNAELYYFLTEGLLDYFTIDKITGIVSTTKLLTDSNIIEHSLTVEARDKGVPILSGRAFVTITLLDENDHCPTVIFQYVPSDAGYAVVDENAVTGFPCALVTVTDADEGDNGESDLTIQSGNEQGHFQLINYGEVYAVQVAAELDRERISEYNLTFIAEDRGSPPCTSTSFLIIYVDDINDHLPEFEQSDYYSVLSESVPPGSFVQGVTATDDDSGINALVFYTISQGNENGWFYIDKDTGLVTTIKVLDRELSSIQILTLVAYNEGSPDYFATSYLHINITDENDERPLFTNSIFNFSVLENQNPGAITSIQALDSDEGINGTVFYKFDDLTLSVFGSLFSIDSSSGLISTLQILDYEENKEYILFVIAFDGGDPPLESSVTVTLQIGDTNDNFPVFYPVLYIADIIENSPVGTFVTQVAASDADSGNFGNVLFQIIGDSSDGKFIIESTTGIITTTQVLDREEQAKYILILSAADGGGKNTHVSASVEINVINIQDTPPIFSQMGYFFTLYENLEVGSEVGTVDATSNDSDNITYIVFLGDSNNVFQINPTEGKIITIKTVDREEQSLYNLIIIANGGQVTSQVQVNISILDLNDNSPSFQHLFDSVDIVEDWAIGHEVYQAQALDGDSGPNSRVFYELTINPDNNFWINETSGVLYLFNEVSYSPTTEYLVQIKALDSGTPQLSSFLNLTVYVRDVNNHPPVFLENIYNVDISESTSVNEQFYTLTALDEDIGENGEVLYYILSGNEGAVFGIFPDGNMYVKNKLDREVQDLYELIVVAADKGIPQFTSTVTLMINLQDENDNRPLFESTSYFFFLDEESPAGTTIGALIANDPDLGRNSELFYEFSTNQTNFVISNIFGIITSLSQFDRELGSHEFTLDALVKDNGITPLSDLTLVTIYISDVNDNIPLFSQEIYKAAVSESAINGTPVLQVVATDADLEENGYIVYSIIDGNTEGHFDISLTSGQIKLIGQLDHETQTYYEFTVKAQDNGKNVLSSFAQVLIQIADENDNEPEFLQTIYTVSISENTQIGVTIITVSAIDRDSAGNSLVSYAITEGNEKSSFGINPDSGEIYLTNQLDFEIQPAIVLTITAYDSGIPQLFNSTQLIITVFDSNDNKPLFSQSSVAAQLAEGVQIGTPVLQVTATDPDSGLNGEIEYSIVSQLPSGFNFIIDANDGYIYTADEIDREALIEGFFEIVVKATDKAPTVSERKWSSLTVTLVIDDINDNAPIFISQSAIILSSNIQIGHEVTQVLTEDADINLNGEIVYSMENYWFEIDANSGIITLTNPLDVPPLLYDILITASDNGENRLSTLFNLTIIMSDNSNTGPEFSMDTYSTSISEDLEVGTSILQVHAENIGDTSNINYFITSVTVGSLFYGNYFNIESESGIVTTAQLLDRETGLETFYLDIYAVDIDSDEPRTTYVQAIIILLDVNDNTPIFQLDIYSASIIENTESGILVETVKAIDNDIGNNAIVVYSIYNGNDANSFAIDSQTGEIFTHGILDRELIPIFNLEIHASDGSSFSSTIVRINIIDVNDNAPAFTSEVYSFEAREDINIDISVAEVLATDPDSGSNGVVTYMLESADYVKTILFLDSESGVITLIGKLDFEQDKHFILTVIAIDGGSPSHNTSAIIYFNILDVNDNLPIFESDRYAVEIFENIAIETTILTLHAFDVDSGVNAELAYSITGGDTYGQFTVLADGSLINIHLIDRETTSFYNLEITVTDQALIVEERFSSTVEVSIILKDINDNVPSFTSSLTASVSEGAIIGTIIMEIYATDKDLGDNSFLEFSPLPNFGDVFNLGQDGYLRVFGNLDRENMPNYTLTITVNDKGQPMLSSTIDLFVSITDENDNSPISEFPQYGVNLSEDIPIGTEILQIIAKDNDEELNGLVSYSIFDGNYDSDFNINPSNGIISVSNRLDYERRELYSLTIQMTDAGKYPLSSFCMVLVTITDINDEIPTFSINPLTIEVMENAVNIPTFAIHMTAVDNDSGINGKLKYKIVDFHEDNSLFLIEEETGVVVVNKSLDRENEAAYILIVEASDSGTPSLTGTGTLNIIVGDINDNTPIFQRNSYLIDIYEGLPIDSSVLVVHATDLDDGFNSQIRYELSADVSGIFTIDPFSGLIVTTAILDFEMSNFYQFNVFAWDRSLLEPLFSTSEITVTVLNSNDNPPLFLSKELIVHMPKDAPAGAFVIGVQAIDLDGDELIYSIITGTDLNKFTIDSRTGVVTSTTPFQNEEYNYTLHIQVSDTLQTDDYIVIITFQATSNFPTFSPTLITEFSYSESQSSITEIIEITASSTKSDSANTISYYIAGGNIGSAFSIDSETGQLTLIGNLDYELVALYSLWIEARDSDHIPLSSYIQFSIHITDENDEVPVFSELIYYASVPEELINYPVITVSATDRDSGINGEFYYELASTDITNPLFIIDASTGSLKTLYKLDREITNIHYLTVYAIDKGDLSLSGTASIEIVVEDINDNCMKVDILSAQIPENSPIGSYILTATYTDADESSNAIAQFNFATDGNPDEIFFLDSSGVLSTNSELDYELHDTHLLRAVAFDEFCSLNFYITIFVTDINDNAPVFSSTFYEISIQEKLPVNTIIFNVSASDEDIGDNGLIYYRLKSLTDIFGVDETTGSVYLKRELLFKSDGEISNANIYSVEIFAIDFGIPSLYNDTKLLISIYEENLYTPVFDKAVYSSPIPLNVPLETKIIQVFAHDSHDNGNNADISYLISDGNGTNYFMIDSATGWIKLANSLEESQNVKYHLVIRAQDKGTPVQYAEVDVFFIITDVNSHTPTLDPTYEVDVLESRLPLYEIATLYASDDDTGVNGQVSYFILEGNNENIFNLDSNTGILSLVFALDFEKTQIHFLTIISIDGGFYSKNATTLFTIRVEDVNDNSPVFDVDIYNTNIFENSVSGTYLLTVHAVDIDSSLYNDISYAIIGGSGKEHFTIDQLSGNVTSQGTLDFEVSQFYELTVWAGNIDTFFSGTSHVIIELIDVNEYVPFFDQEEYTFDIPEDAVDSYYVGMVLAFDNDGGTGGKIFYYLVAESKEKGFSLDKNTGQLYLSYANGRIDREMEDIIILNVIAKNDGVIQGDDIDYTTIIIFVLDANDPPIFSQPIYELYNISEGIAIGSSIITLNAEDNDLDSSFTQFYYFTNDLYFAVGNTSGEVSSIKELDREEFPIYSFSVFAIDKGIPSQTGSAVVVIYLLDVNDNGPYFTSENNVGYIFENEDPGNFVMTLIASDIDTTPNQGPFSFTILENEESKYFSLSSTNSNILQSTTSFDRELKNQYVLLIQGMDSGIPTATSTSVITIYILDKNDNPSSFRNATITVNAFNGIFSGGLIGAVHPNDPDVDDNFICEIIAGHATLFTINSGCDLYSSYHSGDSLYQLEISGNDGVHLSSISSFDINFQSYNNASLENSVTLRLANLTFDVFLNKMVFLLNAFSNLIDTEYKLMLLDVFNNTPESYLDILLTIKDSNNNYNLQRNEVAALFISIKDDIEQVTGISIIDIDINSCDSNPCLYGGICSDIVEVSNEIVVSNAENNIFVRHKSHRVPICTCQNLYTGQFCEQPPNNCNENSCLNGGICYNELDTYYCECPEGTTGDNCEDLNECEYSNPCQNDGTCLNEVGHYMCQCISLFTGVNCETKVDFCDPQPCNGRECINKETEYTCQCCFGDQGYNCQEEATGFLELSFKQYESSLSGSQNKIDLQFSTFMEDAILLYNHDNNEPANGEAFSEFIALEIIGGSVVFSYALGAITGNVRIKTEKKVNDGNWHSVMINRVGAIGILEVDECSDEEQPNFCKGEKNAGNLTTLDLDGMFINIGGIPSIKSIIDRPGQVSTTDFIGCMRDIIINEVDLKSVSLIDSFGLASCPCSIGVCDSNPCLNDGICIDQWFGYICNCTDGYMGDNCEKERTSFSFRPNSYVAYIINESYRRSQTVKDLLHNRKRREIVTTSFSLKFRTRTESGLILTYSDNVNQFLVLIKQNILHFTFGTKDFYKERLSEESEPEVFILNKEVTDGIWYTLKVQQNNEHMDIIIEDDLSLQINETYQFIQFPPLLNFLVIFDLYVGGSIQPLYYEDELINGFSGCLDNLVINEEKMPFSGVTEIIQAEPSPNVLEGCESSECDSDPCPINTVCIDEWEAYSCSFASCELNPCKNNGTCIPSGETFDCECIPGFNGGNCEFFTCETYICGTEEECQVTETGNTCVALPSKLDNTVLSIIVVGVIIVCAFILIVVVVILIMIRRRKQNISNSKSQSLNDSSKRKDITGVPNTAYVSSEQAKMNVQPDIIDTETRITSDHFQANNEAEFYPIETASIPPSDLDVPYYYKQYHKRDKISQPTYQTYGRNTSSIIAPLFVNNPDNPYLYTYSESTGSQHTPTSYMPFLQVSSQAGSLTPVSGLQTKSFTNKKLINDGIQVKNKNPTQKEPSSVESRSSSHLKSPLTLQEPPGLSEEEIRCLNTAPLDANCEGSKTSLNAHSMEGDSSSCDIHNQNVERNVSPNSLLEPPDSSTDDDNDSFTCSEYEHEDLGEISASMTDPTSVIFGKLAQVENEVDDVNKDTQKDFRYEGLESASAGSLSTLFASEDEGVKSNTGEHLSWDSLLNWGPSFENLVGVFADIAQLHDSQIKQRHFDQLSSHEEYV